MFAFQQKIGGYAKAQGKNSQSEEIKQPSEAESDMTQILELLDREFKIMMTDLLRILMEKVNMWEHMGKVSRQMKNFRRIKIKY